MSYECWFCHLAFVRQSQQNLQWYGFKQSIHIVGVCELWCSFSELQILQFHFVKALKAILLLHLKQEDSYIYFCFLLNCFGSSSLACEIFGVVSCVVIT